MKARFGDEPPPLTSPSLMDAPAPSSVRDPGAIRLQSVAVKNFRAYRKPQIFDLSADVTVLYGPNGFGKTSFFDAIDFATTGEIGRLGLGSHANKAKFNKTVAHLDSTPENSIVSLAFTSNGVDRQVVRRVSSRMYPRLDGQLCDRKSILAEITGRSVSVGDRVENLVSLFRATHLFSQEHQELVKGFKHNCELSEPVVSRMLAFEDYASASKKVSSVRKIVKAEIERARADIRKVSGEVEADSRELDRLGHAVQEQINAIRIDEAVDTLRRRVEEAGIQGVSTRDSDLEFARLCQITIQARHSESQARLDRLSEIAGQVAAMPTLVKDLESLQEKQRRWEQSMANSQAALREAEKEKERNDLLLKDAQTERSNAQDRSNLLKWVIRVKPRVTQELQRQSSSFEQLKHAMNTLEQLRDSESKAARKLRIQEGKLKHQKRICRRTEQR